MYLLHHAEVFRLWRIYPHLALTSKLDAPRWDMRSGFKSCALEPLLTGLCINMMYAVASYLCRGIEAVITGLTRNFVVTLEPPTLNPLIYKGFPQFK